MITEEMIFYFLLGWTILIVLPIFYLLFKYQIRPDKIFSLNFDEITKDFSKPIFKLITNIYKINEVFVRNFATIYFYGNCIVVKDFFGCTAMATYDNLTLEKILWFYKIHVEVEGGSFDLSLFSWQVQKIKDLIEAKKNN